MRNIVTASIVLAASSAAVSAQIDHLSILVDANTATGGSAFGSFGYDPTTNTMLVSSFGAGASLRKVLDLDTTPTSEIIASEAQIQLYYREGDPTRGVTTPVISSIVFNPAAVGAIPAYGSAWINDAATTRLPGGSTTIDPTVTKRTYRYNLGTIPPGGDGRDIFSTLVTVSDIQAASGASSTSTNWGRQAAFSPTGQSLYCVETTTSHGGVYHVDPITGALSRILVVDSTNATDRLIAEPAVIRVGSADRILIDGNTPGGNSGGINYFDFDGVTASAQSILLDGNALYDFLELPAGTGETDITSIHAAADGTIYFYESQSDRILKLDTQGRLVKLATRDERDLAFTGDTTSNPRPSASVLRLQSRTINHPTAGSITQLMYAEFSPINSVAAIDDFLVGDFDRDGTVTAADLDQLDSVLTVRGVQSALSDAKFDLNGNQVIDYTDIKILQSFTGISDGDADLDFDVDFSDLLAVARNFGAVGTATWIAGDFTGDDNVDFTDLLALARNFGGDEAITTSDGISAEFASEWNLARSVVPEPATLGLIAAGALLGLKRNRRSLI